MDIEKIELAPCAIPSVSGAIEAEFSLPPNPEPDQDTAATRIKGALEHILGIEVSGFVVLALKPDGVVATAGIVDMESPEGIRRMSRAMAISVGKLLS